MFQFPKRTMQMKNNTRTFESVSLPKKVSKVKVLQGQQKRIEGKSHLHLQSSYSSASRKFGSGATNCQNPPSIALFFLFFKL